VTIGEETSPQVYNGTFGFASIEISVRVECVVSYYYPNCDTACVHQGTCTCLPGYTGNTCDVLLDPCIASPCPNNSICISQPGEKSHTCDCLPGFIGDDCAKDPCFGVNCSGNGECVLNKESEPECNCTHDFVGSQCEESFDDCSGQNCSGHGKCEDKLGGFVCHCNNGYSGATCEESVCTDVDCSGNGQCLVTPGGTPQCMCNAAYTGSLCATRNLDCTVTNCSQTQVCELREGEDSYNYRCTCKPGYMGDDCLTFVGCDGTNCSGHGKCELGTDGTYSCKCSTGFTGKNCNHPASNSTTSLHGESMQYSREKHCVCICLHFYQKMSCLWELAWE